MLKGIDLADSITVDPHKWFYMPFSAGGILVRDGDVLRHSFLVHPEYYMEGRAATASGGGDGRRTSPTAAASTWATRSTSSSTASRAAVASTPSRSGWRCKLIGRRQFAAWIENDIYLARLLSASLRRERDFAHPRAQHPGHLQLPLGTAEPAGAAAVQRPRHRPAQPPAPGTGRARGRRLVQHHGPERPRGPARQRREPPHATREHRAPRAGPAPVGRPDPPGAGRHDHLNDKETTCAASAPPSS